MPIKDQQFHKFEYQISKPTLTIPQETTAGFIQTPKNYHYNNHVLQESRQLFGGYN